MKEHEIRKINTLLLMKLCREIGEKEKINKHKAQMCTLIVNNAITQLKEV